MRTFLAFCILLAFLVPTAAAQQSSQSSRDQTQELPDNPNSQSTPTPTPLHKLPIEWLIGPYIPVQEELRPLTNDQRTEIYLKQTFLTVGSYLARGFSAGLDQANGAPHEWGGGLPGYGRRYAARYGEFVVQSTIVAGGNALLGYEPRYDFCRCKGFWPRTLHAVSRNFVAYNRTERELRPQVPTYVGAFAAGMSYNAWLPGQHNIWTGGAYNVLSQAGIGSAYNLVSEFSLDILHAFGIHHRAKPEQ
jgi:hypothetical protein